MKKANLPKIVTFLDVDKSVYGLRFIFDVLNSLSSAELLALSIAPVQGDQIGRLFYLSSFLKIMEVA
jgi:hypothetical protein